MNIKTILKFAAVGGGLYALSNVSFQYGKGFMLRKLKEYDITVEEAIDIAKEDAKNETLGKRINNKIIEVTAKPKQ